MTVLLLRRMRRNAAAEDGVIALATLAFMIAAGMAVIVLLWSIGVITGAFNSLYAANQAAAYAAASATAPQDPSNLFSTDQLGFQCQYGTGDPTLCTGGKSLDAAQAVMNTMLDPSRPGDFGLDYGSNVFLTDETFTRAPVLRAYPIARTPGSAKAQAAAYGCNIPAGSDAGYTAISGNPNATALNCWRLHEFGLDFPTQYTSAVVTRAQAKLNVVPGCSLSICNVTLQVVAAASQDQPNPFTCYSEYYGTTCSKRNPTGPVTTTPPPTTTPAICRRRQLPPRYCQRRPSLPRLCCRQ